MSLHFNVGCYRITLPAGGVVVGAKRVPPADTEVMVARLGSFEITAHTDDGTLDDWREFVGHSTKFRASICDVEVNGIPGLTIPPNAQNTRRLDYTFKAAGRERIDIVAWANVQSTTEHERQAVADAIQTLSIRSPTVIVPHVV